MKIRTLWEITLPIFSSINKKTGAILIIEKERLYEFDPLNYKDARWKLKQRTSDAKKMIVAGYLLQNGSYAFVLNDKEETRIGIINFD